MPSTQIQSTVHAYNIRRNPGYVPTKAAHGELYTLNANDTRGWFGVDYHTNEQMYYGMLVQVEFDCSSLPTNAVVTSAKLKFNVENNPAQVAVYVALGGSWTPPPSEDDYNVNLALSDEIASMSLSAGSTGLKVMNVPTSAVAHGLNRWLLFAADNVNSSAYDWLELSAGEHCYLRVSFPLTLELSYEVQPPEGTGFLEGVFAVGTGSGGTTVAQAPGYLEGVLKVIVGEPGPEVGQAPGALEGILLVDFSVAAHAQALGFVEGVFVLENFDGALNIAPGSLEGVLLIDVSYDQGGGTRGIGSLEGVLLLSPEFQGGGDVTFTDVLPFSVTGQAQVTADRNAVMLGSVSMSSSGTLSGVLATTFLLPSCEISSGGSLVGGLGLHGTIETEASIVVGGKLTINRS